ncbi:putative GIY-YIG superfamily endonuclease [Planomicrobium stackebrandtii]|uniref:GIY-YIG superfamily endonuclease n=1 Tax=Planomicrobium stackebrandtii TaxID=253160 RepID=A0ABU0GTB7_9BACL|nr:GIY-YIG nuclease family protein [Planomicrobium stackebrandtii]MDQ0428548.1 putative GIY-YIG superfamily endonuclease [Planomicrobium stackebrandtii]
MVKNIFNKLFSSKAAPEPSITPPTVQQHKIYLFESNQYELEKIIDSPDLQGKAPGYVYFVQEYMNGSFKIGKTKNLEKRMNIFGVKLPFENKLIFLIKTGNHHQTEAAFHKHFSAKRLEGEWFALNKEDLAWIKAGKYTVEINQTILPLEEKKTAIKTEDENKEDKLLTSKQVEFAKTLLTKLENEYELATDLATLTQKDLNRLSGYFRFKNKGALNNLVAAGVLKEK